MVVAEVYLEAGQPTQRALLHRTLGSTPDAPRVEGATVRIDGDGGGWLQLAPVPPSECLPREPEEPGPGSSGPAADTAAGGSCYAATAPGFVQEGRSYGLEVIVPDGRRLGGRTTVPGAFEVVRPAADTCRLEGASLDLTWTRSAGAWAYQVDVLFSGLAEGLRERGVADPPDTLRLIGLAVGAADTTLVFPTELGVFDRFDLDRELLLALQQGLPDGARADIVVAAGDRNFVNWARGGSFNPSGQVRVPSVTGDGTGVFASLVTRRRTLVAPGFPSGEEGPSCR